MIDAVEFSLVDTRECPVPVEDSSLQSVSLQPSARQCNHMDCVGVTHRISCNRGDCGHGPKESMANKFPNLSQDKTADILLAIGAGFLSNLIISAAIAVVRPFIAGVVAVVIVK